MRSIISSITVQSIFQIPFLAPFVTEFKGFGPFKHRFEMRPGFSSFKTDFFGMGGLIITVHIDFDPGFRKNFIDPTLLYTAQSRKMRFKPQLLLKFKIISLE